MSKIFKLKKWLSLEDAAKRLTLELEEEVSIGDILQLCVDNELKISVNFPHDWKGIICDVTTDKEKAINCYEDITLLDGEVHRVCKYEQCSENEYIRKLDRANFNSGIYEVKLIGNSKLDVEFELKKEKRLPLVDVFCLSGFYVLDKNKTVIERQTMDYGAAYCDIKTKKEYSGSFDYPCSGITEIEGAFFVIQTIHIEEFLSQFKEPNESKKTEQDDTTEIPPNTNREKLREFIELVASDEFLENGRLLSYSRLHSALNAKHKQKKIPSKNTIGKYINEIE